MELVRCFPWLLVLLLSIGPEVKCQFPIESRMVFQGFSHTEARKPVAVIFEELLNLFRMTARVGSQCPANGFSHEKLWVTCTG